MQKGLKLHFIFYFIDHRLRATDHISTLLLLVVINTIPKLSRVYIRLLAMVIFDYNGKI